MKVVEIENIPRSPDDVNQKSSDFKRQVRSNSEDAGTKLQDLPSLKTVAEGSERQNAVIAVVKSGGKLTSSPRSKVC